MMFETKRFISYLNNREQGSWLWISVGEHDSRCYSYVELYKQIFKDIIQILDSVARQLRFTTQDCSQLSSALLVYLSYLKSHMIYTYSLTDYFTLTTTI